MAFHLHRQLGLDASHRRYTLSIQYVHLLQSFSFKKMNTLFDAAGLLQHTIKYLSIMQKKIEQQTKNVPIVHVGIRASHRTSANPNKRAYMHTYMCILKNKDT